MKPEERSKESRSYYLEKTIMQYIDARALKMQRSASFVLNQILEREMQAEQKP